MPLAATPIERYATCPFRYYLADVLRIAPPLEPERVVTLAPADRGLFLHAVLAALYTRLQEAGRLPLRRESLPDARVALDAAFADVEARFGPTGLAPFWRGERARLVADVWAAVEAEAREAGDWVPTAFEVRFGDAPATVAHDAGGERALAFAGRLDRIDVSADGARARVIDYKAGRPRGAGGKLAGGTALQLPIYRLGAAALARVGGREVTVEEAQYYYLTRRGGRRRVRFTADDWAARRADFDRALGTVLDGIAAGRFFQNPSPEICRFCDYQAACGPGRERMAWVEAKRGDPVRDPYTRLGEIE
jgi:ATP-dependent helicase/nuclease subunit B